MLLYKSVDEILPILWPSRGFIFGPGRWDHIYYMMGYKIVAIYDSIQMVLTLKPV